MTVPPPPGGVSACDKVITLSDQRTWYRIQAGWHPVAPWFNTKSGGNGGRWNSPSGGFGVCYVAESLAAAFAESYGHDITSLADPGAFKFVGPIELAIRRVLRFEPRRPLHLVDLTGAGLPLLNLDMNILSTSDYLLTQPWAEWLYGCPGPIDGIIYRSRHLPNCLCAALFDRCETALTTHDEGVVYEHPDRDAVLDAQGWTLMDF